MPEVKTGDVVRVNYTGKLTDGTQFDSSSDRGPLQFRVGAGEIIAGLDRQVSGMEVGHKTTVTVPAAEAYGQRDEAQVQSLPREAIPEEIELAEGTRLQAQTPDGRQIGLTVIEHDEQKVTVDANHPLAGKDLVFDIEVLEIVTPAS